MSLKTVCTVIITRWLRFYSLKYHDIVHLYPRTRPFVSRSRIFLHVQKFSSLSHLKLEADWASLIIHKEMNINNWICWDSLSLYVSLFGHLIHSLDIHIHNEYHRPTFLCLQKCEIFKLRLHSTQPERALLLTAAHSKSVHSLPFTRSLFAGVCIGYIAAFSVHISKGIVDVPARWSHSLHFSLFVRLEKKIIVISIFRFIVPAHMVFTVTWRRKEK